MTSRQTAGILDVPLNSRRRAVGWSKFLGALAFAVVLIGLSIGLDSLGLTTFGPGTYRVIDGDSLRRGNQDIRLFGIDAPEAKQSCNDGQGTSYKCGEEATNALKLLVTGKSIECQSQGKDKYDRHLAVCRFQDLEINREMIRQGWAVAYDKHGFSYVLAERDARKAQRGMWYGDFEMPEDYRARNRKAQGNVLGPAEFDE